MRILTVIAEMGSGGAETVVADLALHQLGAGHAPRVASSGGWRADELRTAGVPTVEVPLRDGGPVALARSAASVARESRRHPADLVHTHNVRATLAARAGTRLGPRWGLRRPPLVTTVHGLADSDYARAARLLRGSDLVVAVSDDVAERLRRGGLDPSRLRVVENAVPTRTAAAGSREQVRAELRLGDGPVTLCVARLAAPKRIDLLIDAWSEVPGTLLVAGDGPDRAALTRRAAPYGDRVRLLGTRRDVDRLLAAADVLVLPTDREGLPMVVLEAMAAGVPVVASAVGGLLGLDTDAAELVPPGSAPALAEALRVLHADDAHRTALVKAGRDLVAERFSAARMRASYDAVYAEVSGGGRSP